MEWISVKDRLPEEAEQVLIYGNYLDSPKEILLAYYSIEIIKRCKHIHWFQGYEGYPDLTSDEFQVIAWSHLPKPEEVERIINGMDIS